MEKVMYFEDLVIWKEGMTLCKGVYELVRSCKDYSFKDQIQRAAVSIPSNIAEGFERQSNKEFIHFLYIAKGSCGEVRTQLYIARELNYAKEEDFSSLLNKAKMLSSLISNLIQTRKKHFS